MDTKIKCCIILASGQMITQKKLDNTTDSESTVVNTSSIVFHQKKLNIVVSAEKWQTIKPV